MPISFNDNLQLPELSTSSSTSLKFLRRSSRSWEKVQGCPWATYNCTMYFIGIYFWVLVQNSTKCFLHINEDPFGHESMTRKQTTTILPAFLEPPSSRGPHLRTWTRPMSDSFKIEAPVFIQLTWTLCPFGQPQSEPSNKRRNRGVFLSTISSPNRRMVLALGVGTCYRSMRLRPQRGDLVVLVCVPCVVASCFLDD